MKSVRKLTLLVLCCAVLPSQAQTTKPAAAAPQASAIGRLFFTPEQREQLDLLRLKKVVASQAKDEPPPEIITYEGIVRRTDGQTTVWVNNKALTERELRDAPAIAGRIERDGRLRLQTGQAGQANQTAGTALHLKVGQRAELSSGRIEERPATDTRNAISEMRSNPGSAAKPATAESAVKPAQAEKPSAQPPAPTAEDVAKAIQSDPAVAAKFKALTDSNR